MQPAVTIAHTPNALKLALIQYSSSYDGSTISGAMIARGMRERGMNVDLYFGTDGPFLEKIRPEFETVEVIPHKNWLRAPGIKNFLKNLWRERQPTQEFVKAFSNNRPDCVYSNTMVSYAAMRAAEKLKIPAIWHVRELFHDVGGELCWPNSFLKPFLRKRICSMARTLVVNSGAVGENVFGDQPPKSYHNVPNAVAPKFFAQRGDAAQCRNQLNLPQDLPIVGVPATFREMKGHSFFVSAIPLILEQIPNCHFVMTGGLHTPVAESVLAEVKTLGLDEHVTFTGSIEDMLSFYHACDVCCVPSKSEPFGRTAIECLATQTPLVASAVGGLREIVDSGTNGLLVEFGQTQDLAAAVLKLLKDHQLAESFARTGHAAAKEKYTEEAYLSRIDDVLSQALGA